MKIILSLIAWTTGSLALTIFLPVVILILHFVPRNRISLICQISMRFFTRAFLVRVRCEGREKIDKRATHVYMANHSSFFDFLILGGWLQGDMSGLEAAEHFSWPVWGRFLKAARMVPIDRSNPRASLKSINKAAEYLRNGISMLILPEGTRTRDGKMLPFKKLPFKMAKKGEASIVPVGLVGAFEVKKKTHWLLQPGRVIMRFGDPISAEAVQEMDLETLKNKTRETIAALINQGYGVRTKPPLFTQPGE